MKPSSASENPLHDTENSVSAEIHPRAETKRSHQDHRHAVRIGHSLDIGHSSSLKKFESSVFYG